MMKINLPGIRVIPNPQDVDESFLSVGNGMITLRVQRQRDTYGNAISAKAYHNDTFVARVVNKLEDNEDGDEWWVMDDVKNAAASNMWAALVLGFVIRGATELAVEREWQ